MEQSVTELERLLDPSEVDILFADTEDTESMVLARSCWEQKGWRWKFQ